MSGESLSDGSVVAWYCLCTELNEATRRWAAAEVLSPEERERMARFRRSEDRLLFLGARLLLRSMLAAHSDLQASAWRFEIGSHGKPEPGEGCPSLHFNLSHSSGVAVCALHAERPVGIDVEPRHREVGEGTRQRVLSESEWESLPSTGVARAEAFMRYWVLKESYIKAVGLGLSLPLKEISFAFDKSGRPRLESTGLESERPQDWRFHEFEPTPNRIASIAVPWRNDQEPRFRVARFLPDDGEMDRPF